MFERMPENRVETILTAHIQDFEYADQICQPPPQERQSNRNSRFAWGIERPIRQSWTVAGP
jgi:hypothetical protein